MTINLICQKMLKMGRIMSIDLLATIDFYLQHQFRNVNNIMLMSMSQCLTFGKRLCLEEIPCIMEISPCDIDPLKPVFI